MPILNREDAVEVEARIARTFADASPADRAAEIRALFVETLDFDAASGEVPLHPAPKDVELPAAAERIAESDGVHVLYIALDTPDTDRVRKTEAAAAARLIADQLGEDLLLLFTNPSASQLHLVHPSFEGARPTLRRMIVERDLPRRTAVQQVSNIYWYRQDTGSIRSALDRAFDVEAVTRHFFDEYKRVFDHAVERVEGFGADDDEQDLKKLFVQTLFNRLMFVYFVSRKGWLTFGGDNDYLNAIWSDYQTCADEDSNFHYDRLRLLFFAGLNNYRAEDLTSEPEALKLIGDVPFLNGGLFDKRTEDNRSQVIVPDECVSSVFEDLFEKFNFTVMESTPFDIEVAVDPEMLGKVFEELVTGRHDTGSYYTPRPVVSFMCREALKGYLEGQDTGLDSEAIAGFVDERKTSGISQIAAPRIAGALENVTVVDPACGSGAYLLGMMQELVDLRTTLFNVGIDPKSLYELKLHIIQRNLYGVDIDEFAANIAMLRMWLSLAVEYERDKPEPLPNLDFKIVQGDSLLGPDPSPDNYGDLFRHRAHELAARLADRKGSYMNESSAEKNALKVEIACVEDELREALADTPAPEGAVDWRVQFAEVFDRGGFDIAIANPPYVRQERIKPAKYKNDLLKGYGSGAVARSDLYCYFYVRALQLLKVGGQHAFVCSNSWLDVRYGAKLQEFLLKNSHVLAIIESAIERQFSTARINTIISLIKNGAPRNADKSRFVRLRERFEAAIAPGGNRREIPMRHSELMAAATSGNRFVGEKWGGKYLRAPSIYHYILDKCASQLVRLGSVANVRFGLKTGANKFFYLTPERVKQWEIDGDFIHPVLTSPQESRRILVDPASLRRQLFMCHKDRDKLVGTGALAYIEWGESQYFHKRRSVSSRRNWYDLGKRDTTQLAMNKLVNTTVRTYFSPSGMLFTDNFQEIHAIPTMNAELCVAMNSTLSQLMLNVDARTNFGQGVLEVQTYESQDLRLVHPNLLSKPRDGTFNNTDWDVLTPSQSRLQIDAIVFEALNLTQDERDAVYEGVVDLVQNRLLRARSA